MFFFYIVVERVEGGEGGVAGRGWEPPGGSGLVLYVLPTFLLCF